MTHQVELTEELNRELKICKEILPYSKSLALAQNGNFKVCKRFQNIFSKFCKINILDRKLILIIYKNI